jgi:hypothetical protein
MKYALSFRSILPCILHGVRPSRPHDGKDRESREPLQRLVKVVSTNGTVDRTSNQSPIL